MKIKNYFCLLVCVLLMVVVACSKKYTYQELTAKYCGSSTEDSVILKIFGDPTNEDLLLQVANGVMLAKNIYSVELACVVFDECEKYLSMDDMIITGADVFNFAMERISALKSLVGDNPMLLMLSPLAPAINVPDILTACDKQLLLAHIAKQRIVLSTYQ